MKYTFRGGTHVEEHKLTAASPLELMTPPKTLSIPMSQHIGVPCRSLVSIGDTVLLGQKIGDVDKDKLGCPIHSPVSGKVIGTAFKTNAQGAVVEHIIIENDGNNTLSPDFKPFPKPYSEATPDEIIDFIRDRGIVGMGGAMFPTYAKIKSALGKVDCMIVNCAECEPYITTDHRMMLERPHTIIGGIRILLHALGLSEAIIAIEDNKADAIETIRKEIGDSTDVRICVCKTKYPQGDERQIMYAVTKRELPPGKLPADIGCILFNCSTCSAVYHAFTHGRPTYRRVITVSGDCIKTPKNLIALIGTPYRDLIEYCGGLIKDPEKLISGGPMMGAARWDLDAPMIKGTSALLALSYDICQHYDQPPVCIRCGRCIKNCPMHLMPNYIARYAMEKRYKDCESMGVMSCVECGTCSYNCPGQMMIVQHIRVAKGAIRAEKAKKQG